jgi:hypothetical protein
LGEWFAGGRDQTGRAKTASGRIGEDSDEEVAVAAILPVVIDRAHTEFEFQIPEDGLEFG